MYAYRKRERKYAVESPFFYSNHSRARGRSYGQHLGPAALPVEVGFSILAKRTLKESAKKQFYDKAFEQQNGFGLVPPVVTGCDLSCAFTI